jgi:threonine aldolase
MNFASDNTAGVAPEIMAALHRANDGFTLGYGNDDWTRRVEQKFSALFERDVAVFLVPTGTGANALALAHVTPPWGAVLCHQNSHIAADECGAPEFFGGGIKLVELPGDDGKIAADTLKTRLGNTAAWGPPHHVTPAAVSISQASEAGTIYRVAEIRALADIAHEHGAALHMDGARFGNALVRLNVSAADMTWKAGIDVLSFGATKGGAMGAEAVIFFDPKRAEGMSARRKRGGALLSKHRFIAAQMEAFLDGDLWLRLARHANGMADRLGDGLTQAGYAPVWPVEANEVFAALPVSLCDKLQAGGAMFYRWDADANGNVIVRLVTSFQTTAEEVERFVELARSA